MESITNPIQKIMMKIQMPFVVVLNKCLGLTGRLSSKQRSILTFVLAAFFSIFLLIVISRFNPIDMQKKAIVFIIGMIAIILVNLDKKLEVKPWNLSIIVPYYIVAILMIITSFTHNTGRGELEIIGLIMIFIFTPFYILIGNKSGEEMENFFAIIAKGFCYTGLAYIVVLFLFFPQATQYVPDTGIPLREYAGINTNPNALGFVLCSIVACSMYLYVRGKEKVVPLVVIASSLQLMVLSIARASQLAFVVMLILMLICMIYYYKTNLNKLGKGIILGGIAAGFVVASQPLWEYLFNYIQIVNATAGEENQSLYDKLNLLSTGRLEIYVHYIENIGLFGTDASHMYRKNDVAYYAHNSFIEIAFKSGIFAGIAYVVMIFTSLFYSIRLFIKSKGGRSLFGVIVIGGFICYSMIETAIIPFHDGFVALVYFAVAGVIVKEKQIQNEVY